MEKVRIGIIGLGGIGYGKHLRELLTVKEAQIVALCDISPSALSRAAETAGVPAEKCYTDYRDLIADPDVDAVEVCTPNYLHCEMGCAVLRAGKYLNLEKPIAMHYEEAEQLLVAEAEGGRFAMICFSYRFMPAVRYAMSIMQEGKLGNIVGLNVAYLKNSAYWEGRPLEWRFEVEKAGSGVVGDLGSHLIDLAQLLAGEITELAATRATAVHARPRLDGNGMGVVTTDDSCQILAHFAHGAEGSIHITRCAIGHANTIRYDIYGDKGSISFDLNNPNVLTTCFGEGDPKGWRPVTIDVPPEFTLPQEQGFVNAILGRRDPLFPTLQSGAQGQKVIDAVLKASDEKRWVSL